MPPKGRANWLLQDDERSMANVNHQKRTLLSMADIGHQERHTLLMAVTGHQEGWHSQWPLSIMRHSFTSWWRPQREHVLSQWPVLATKRGHTPLDGQYQTSRECVLSQWPILVIKKVSTLFDGQYRPSRENQLSLMANIGHQESINSLWWPILAIKGVESMAGIPQAVCLQTL
jgi:hypothetical protein